MKDVDGIVQTVKQSVTAIQVAKELDIRIDRNGRCCCLWHADKHPSMKLYDGDRGCYCFSCHHGGSVIDMVQAVNGCSFWDAVKWLDGAFHLGLPLDKPMDEKAQEAAQMARKRRKAEREQKQAIDTMMFDLYVDAMKLCGDLEADKERYAPKPNDVAWDKRFCDAMQLLPYARLLADRLAVDVIGVKK